jgi:hypothetical protein
MPGKYLLGELNSLSYGFGEHGQAVLNLELIDLAMPHLAAEPHKFDPCRVYGTARVGVVSIRFSHGPHWDYRLHLL